MSPGKNDDYSFKVTALKTKIYIYIRFNIHFDLLPFFEVLCVLPAMCNKTIALLFQSMLRSSFELNVP